MKYLKHLWNIWGGIAKIIGDVQATIIFSILYFLIFVPVGIILSFSNDYLRVKFESKWLKMEGNSEGLKELLEQ